MQAFELLPCGLVLGQGAVGVAVEQPEGGLAGVFHDGIVVDEVGDAQIEEEAALLGAFYVAGAAQFEVFFGNDEAVGGGDHYLHSPSGVFGQFVFGDEDAVALVGTTTHAPPELVELGEAEAVGVFNDDDGGVGHVDTYLDYGG